MTICRATLRVNEKAAEQVLSLLHKRYTPEQMKTLEKLAEEFGKKVG